MKKKKIKSKQISIFVLFGHYYHERKYQLSLSQAWITTTLSVSLIQETNLLQLQRQKKIIPVKKLEN